MSPDLGQIYDDHAQAIFAFLLNVTRSETETRDVLQELFLKLAANPERLDGVQQTRAYLLRMAHRIAVDAHRRRVRREPLKDQHMEGAAGLFAPAEDPDEGAFHVALSNALAELPPEQRAVVHLKLWEQMTFAEIAEALGIPANTAASRYRYGLEKLQTLLRPLYDEIQ